MNINEKDYEEIFELTNKQNSKTEYENIKALTFNSINDLINKILKIEEKTVKLREIDDNIKKIIKNYNHFYIQKVNEYNKKIYEYNKNKNISLIKLNQIENLSKHLIYKTTVFIYTLEILSNINKNSLVSENGVIKLKTEIEEKIKKEFKIEINKEISEEIKKIILNIMIGNTITAKRLNRLMEIKEFKKVQQNIDYQIKNEIIDVLKVSIEKIGQNIKNINEMIKEIKNTQKHNNNINNVPKLRNLMPV